jgi:hypothetical protein
MALSTACDVRSPAEKFQWLVGRWVGSGKGQYPTIHPFTYGEQVEMRISPGKPLIIYDMKSWKPDTEEPLHFENGFLKIRPHTDDIAFVLAHNFGMSLRHPLYALKSATALLVLSFCTLFRSN